MAVGMESTVAPLIVISCCYYGCFQGCGSYGIAMAADGNTTTGMVALIVAYGPVADNVVVCWKCQNYLTEVKRNWNKLDAVGNSTAAVGKDLL